MKHTKLRAFALTTIAALSIGAGTASAMDSQDPFEGCDAEEYTCGNGGGYGGAWGSGTGTGGGGGGGGGGGTGSGPTPSQPTPQPVEIGSSRGRTCSWLGVYFTCDTVRYRTPINTEIVRCWWVEDGRRTDQIPCHI